MEKQCMKCGCSLSDGAMQCPNCGEPIKPSIMPTWLLIFICIVIPPVGIYVIQAHTYFVKSFKKKLTIILGIWTVIWLSVGMANTVSNNTEPTENVVSDEAKDKVQEDTENDKEAEKETEPETKKEEKTSKTDKEQEEEKPKEKKLSKKQYIEKCKEYNYKKVLRNPDKYIGKKVKIKVKISSVHTSGIINKKKYYFAYSESDYGWYGDRYAIWDKRSKEKPKLLDDDIIYVYGEIIDPVDTVSLIVNSEELFAIDMKYVELLEE